MRLNFLVLFLTFTFCISTVNSKGREETSKDDDDLFVPTREWQAVKEGQKIPRGLHVRLNFETGLTEAKILEENEHEKTRAVAEIPEANDIGAQNSNSESVGSLKFSEAELKKTLKNIKSDDITSNEKMKNLENKFKTYEELKKDLADINLTPKTDADVLKELVSKHKRITKHRLHEELQILTILEDLEFLVHQYDNANEFVNLNGFKDVIFKDLNSSNVEIKQEALKLLGSSVQNNVKVQIHALETGSLGVLLRILVLDSDYGVKNRALFALSGLLRRFPIAQLKFIENAGLNVFVELLEKTKNTKIQLKIITLINDLLLEHKHILDDPNSANFSDKLKQYNQINLKKKLKEHDWCSNLNNLLINIVQIDADDHDAVEKCLNAISSILDTCSAVPSMSIKDIVLKLQVRYKVLTLTESNGGEDEPNFNYYTHVLDLCNQITEYINYRYKSEL